MTNHVENTDVDWQGRSKCQNHNRTRQLQIESYQDTLQREGEQENQTANATTQTIKLKNRRELRLKPCARNTFSTTEKEWRQDNTGPLASHSAFS